MALCLTVQLLSNFIRRHRFLNYWAQDLQYLPIQRDLRTKQSHSKPLCSGNEELFAYEQQPKAQKKKPLLMLQLVQEHP